MRSPKVALEVFLNLQFSYKESSFQTVRIFMSPQYCSVLVCHPSSPSMDDIHGWKSHPWMTFLHPWMTSTDEIFICQIFWENWMHDIFKC